MMLFDIAEISEGASGLRCTDAGLMREDSQRTVEEKTARVLK